MATGLGAQQMEKIVSSKLEQQRKLIQKLRGQQRQAEAAGIEVTTEEALRAVCFKKNRKPKKKRNGNVWSPVLPGNFEGASR